MRRARAKTSSVIWEASGYIPEPALAFWITKQTKILRPRYTMTIRMAFKGPGTTFGCLKSDSANVEMLE